VDWYAAAGDIDNVTFIDNHANLVGALFMGQISANCTIFNSIFESNTAVLYGGAIDCNATRMRLENTTFISNEAQFGAALCRGTYATGGYGYNNTFISNHAFEAGAALGWLGAQSININGYKFINNSADVRGGAIFVGHGSTSCVINNSYFKENFITNDAGIGGAIDSIAAHTQILNTTFEDNHAHDGGAIFVGGEFGNVTIWNSTFSNNRAVGYGGAINLNASSVNLFSGSPTHLIFLFIISWIHLCGSIIIRIFDSELFFEFIKSSCNVSIKYVAKTWSKFQSGNIFEM
jgi:predicted outer membrane repeat protein